MGDKASASTLAQARKELEDLYLGVPDDSVNLSFKDLTSFQQNDATERNRMSSMIAIKEEPKVNKSPSLDFAKALRGTNRSYSSSTTNYGEQYELSRERLARSSFKRTGKSSPRVVVESSGAFDDISVLSTGAAPLGEGGRRKRPGIPHSNICALCSVYIYFFRHRCLVCGRVYCRSCVGIGMGDMSEGRKCVECLGSRFSQRYMKRAGVTGCCWRYPSRVKLQELMWAEKGPRRSGERRYRRGVSPAMLSPTTPSSPRMLQLLRLGCPTASGASLALSSYNGVSHEYSVAKSPTVNCDRHHINAPSFDIQGVTY